MVEEAPSNDFDFCRDFGVEFPLIHAFLHKPIIADPPLCTLREVQDGTYSIDDILVLNQIVDYKMELEILKTAEE